MTRRRPAVEIERGIELEPWDFMGLGIAHAGKWDRVVAVDGTDEFRCEDHGLRADQH